MDHLPHPVAAFIKDKGGSVALAEAIGKKPGSIRMMKHRQRIPRVVWPEILEAYPDITIDDLKAIEASSSSEAAA